MRRLEEQRPQTPSSAYWFWLKMGRVIYCVTYRTRYAPEQKSQKRRKAYFWEIRRATCHKKMDKKDTQNKIRCPSQKKSIPTKAGNRPYLQEIDRERGRGVEECAFFRIFAVPSPS